MFAAVAVNPTMTRAQYTHRECIDLLKQENQAFRARSFKQVIILARQRLTHCREWLATDEYAEESLKVLQLLWLPTNSTERH
jgi:hypothetical protein